MESWINTGEWIEWKTGHHLIGHKANIATRLAKTSLTPGRRGCQAARHCLYLPTNWRR